MAHPPPAAIMPDIHTPISSWVKLPAAKRAALARLGLVTIGDLWHHLPLRHEDRCHSGVFPSSPSDAPQAFSAVVTSTKVNHFGRRKSVAEATLAPPDSPSGTPTVVARWFNLPWLAKSLAPGSLLHVYGKVRSTGVRLVIEHPEIESIESTDQPGIHSGRIVPIYPLSAGITQKALRALIHAAVHTIPCTGLPPMLPPSLHARAATDLGIVWQDDDTTLRQMHYPDSMDALDTARLQWSIAEWFRFFLAVALRRRRLQTTATPPRCGRGVLLKRWADSLPFALTTSQRHVIREIRADLKLPRPMHRLLQGDVGSGKTAVATAAALLAIESGCQVALMAPTQILATQHYLALSAQLTPLGIHTTLLTSATTPLHESSTDRPDLLVGTHALLFQNARKLMHDVGLVIIDEQHKFGVGQRALLLEQALPPHVLVMTATPIPRTLALTLYGDLDASILDELPAGRGEITTVMRPSAEIDKLAAFLNAKLHQGRQAYFVHPLVEESENVDLKAAVSGLRVWQNHLPDHPMALLTGRTPAAERDAIMRAFREGKIKALATTSVIEVGVDVPNANIMVIENAERFGLAQLHQLRGRIGRGHHKSYCILLHGKHLGGDNSDAHRLKVLTTTRDGFRIAETDLALRGPGDLLGSAQSGLPPLSPTALARHTDQSFLTLVRNLADSLLDADTQPLAGNGPE